MQRTKPSIYTHHIFLWLIKDCCWVLSLPKLAVFMIFPTVSLSIYVSYISRVNKDDLLQNLAITSWIIGNSIWIISEFYFEDSYRGLSSIFFLLGILPLIFLYIKIYYRPWKKK